MRTPGFFIAHTGIISFMVSAPPALSLALAATVTDPVSSVANTVILSPAGFHSPIIVLATRP
jgi:hypothetical protein